MRKRLVSLLFAGIMACSVIGSGVTTFAAENDSHINLALFTYIEGMDPATDWCGWNLTRCGVGVLRKSKGRGFLFLCLTV